MGKWENVKLSEIGKIITGNTPKTSEPENYVSDDIPFIKPSDFSDDRLEIGNTEFYIAEAARNKARIIAPETIVVTCIGIIGKTAIIANESAFNQQINAIEVNEKAHNRFVAYAIASQREYLQEFANAAVVPILNKTDFSNIQIPLPPLFEQKKIAAILDKVTDLINLRKKELEKLDLLVKSRFVEMFGYNGRVVPLTKYVWFQEGPGVRSVDFTSEGTILLTGSNINDNELSFGYKSDRFISNELVCLINTIIDVNIFNHIK